MDERGKKVKVIRSFWLLLSILLLIFGPGCTKRSIHTETSPSTLSKMEPRPTPLKPGQEPAAKTEAPSSDTLALQEQERRIREEALREEALRQKSLQEAAAREAASKTLSLESIYFDFDQAGLREDQKEIMMKNAQWLKGHPQARIRIEGNCDERGTAEYNLALGQRRADATKDFLVGLGIASKRMQTISYGFERPLVKGVDEATWAKNRRVDFVLIR